MFRGAGWGLGRASWSRGQRVGGRGQEAESRGQGTGQGGWSRPNGTSRKVNADQDPGGKRPAPGPFPCLAEGQRRAPTLSPHLPGAAPSPGHVEPSPGLQGSLRRLSRSPEPAPFAPGTPARKGQRARAQRGRFPAPLPSSDFGRNGEEVSFSANRPPFPGSFPQPLPFPAPSQPDRRETQRKKNYRPSRSHPPARCRENAEKGAHLPSPPSHPDAVTPAEPGGQEPRGGRGGGGEGGSGRSQAERPSESARGKKISNKTTLTRPLPGCNILWK